MLYAVICSDKPEGLALRQKVRPEHLAFLESLGEQVKGAGPFTDEAGQPTGSLIIIEAADLTSAKNLMASDPYAQAGLFAKVEVRPWKWLIKAPVGV